MLRALIASLALATLGGTANAQGYPDAGGLTVYGQPRDAYVIRLNTRGKDVPTIRREISWASYEACRKAPRTGNVLEMRPTYMSACVNQASFEAHRQLDRLVDQRRRSGVINVAAAGWY